MATARALISGFVQGVGYRAFVKKHATELGLTGWVKNLPDGRVEAILQGEKKTIEQMLELCKTGPFVAEVENVEVLWEESERSFATYEIIHD